MDCVLWVRKDVPLRQAFFLEAVAKAIASRSVEETKDLSSNMLGTSLVVIHDTLVGGKDEDTELTGGEGGGQEVLELPGGQVEAG